MENEIEMITAPPQDSSLLPNLSEAMLTEILLRLPVKSLSRFRCVSKSWHFLISSYRFAKAHLKLSSKNNEYIHDKLIFGPRNFPLDLYTCSLQSLVENPTSPYSADIFPVTHENLLFDRVWFDCPFAEKDDVISLVGSYNGLVCVYIPHRILMLWNPTTRKSKMLPVSGTDLDVHDYDIRYGFGYDESHDDYKVIESFDFKLQETSEHEIQVKVYSMRTNSWKILSNWPGGYTFGGSGIFLNGAIHWSVCDLPHWGIISLNLATDTFLMLPMPKFDDDHDEVEVNMLGGRLAVYCEHSVCECMDVWVMKEYGVKESWTKVVCLPWEFWDNVYLTPKLLFMSTDGMMIVNYGSTLRIYHESNAQNHHFVANFDVVATTYIESLVSPDLDDEIKH